MKQHIRILHDSAYSGTVEYLARSMEMSKSIEVKKSFEVDKGAEAVRRARGSAASAASCASAPSSSPPADPGRASASGGANPAFVAVTPPAEGAAPQQKKAAKS